MCIQSLSQPKANKNNRFTKLKCVPQECTAGWCFQKNSIVQSS